MIVQFLYSHSNELIVNDVSQEFGEQQSNWPATRISNNFTKIESVVSVNLPSLDAILYLADA